MNARERGSASLWVVAAIALVLLVAGIAIARTQAVLARHRAETAADLSALAGAVGIGTVSDPCALAGRIASSNGARVLTCSARLSPDGRSGTVAVAVSYLSHIPLLGERRVTASARAGRDPPA